MHEIFSNLGGDMAIDTVRLRSSAIPEDIAVLVEQKLQTSTRFDNQSGELLYEFISGQLMGSYDNRISVSVRRKAWVRVMSKDPSRSGPELLECEPYLEIEGSVHKSMLGHNVFGGPVQWVSSIAWFLGRCAEGLGVELLDYEWRVIRADWAEVFDITPEESKIIFDGLKHARRGRRKIACYSRETIYWSGTTSTVKIYCKGPEYRKHDYVRVCERLGRAKANMLQGVADNIVRVECEIRAKSFRDAFGEYPLYNCINETWLTEKWKTETEKLLREGEKDLKTIRDRESVRRRLCLVYGERLGDVLYGRWLAFCAHGEEGMRDILSKATYYRVRKQLEDAGVQYIGAGYVDDDIQEKVMSGELLTLGSTHRLCDVDPEIVRLSA